MVKEIRQQETEQTPLFVVVQRPETDENMKILKFLVEEHNVRVDEVDTLN